MPAVKVKRVAVIGAGVSGLLCTKSCLECGLEPVCFEQNDNIGGIWQTSELESFDDVQGGTIYNCLLTNTSKEMMALSDFPMPKEYPPFLRPKQLISYYRDYTENFDLNRHIRLSTEVMRVAPSDDHEATGRWEVRYRPKRGGDGTVTTTNTTTGETSEIFDAVIVSTGMFNTAFTAHYPGQDEFQGEILHSNKFRSGENFRGKTVLVVGSSQSAGDVSVDISRHADQVYMSMRDGTWVIGRYGPGGVPTDSYFNRRWKTLLPDFMARKLAEPIFVGRFNADNLGLGCKRGMAYDMVNDEIPCRILCGAVKCKPGIDRFTPDGVVFEDGTKVDGLDAVVFATGYGLNFPFFEDNSIIADNRADLELYSHVWPARRTHNTLAAVGLIEASGAVAVVFELQARWVAQVFLGNAKLPGLQERLADVKRRREGFLKRFGKHKICVSAVSFSEELADKIGARPNLAKLLLTDPKLAFKCFFGPTYPPSYRLTGPYPWSGAREAIMNGWENTVYPTRTREVTKPSYGGALALLGGTGRVVCVAILSLLMSCTLLLKFNNSYVLPIFTGPFDN